MCGIAETARLFGVARETVDKWRSRGIMPAPDYDLDGGPIWHTTTLTQWGKETGRVQVGVTKMRTVNDW